MSKQGRSILPVVMMALALATMAMAGCSEELGEGKGSASTRPQGAGSVASASHVAAPTSNVEAEEEPSGLIAGGEGDFALWSRGKLSVSEGGEDDSLLFEVDPEQRRTRLWTPLEVDGNAMVSGEVRAQALTATGSIEGRLLEAVNAQVEQIEASSVTALKAQIEELGAEKVDTPVIRALTASLDDITSDTLSAGEIGAVSAQVESIRAHALDVSNVSADALSARDSIVDILHAAYASITTFFAEQAEFGTLVTSYLTAPAAVLGSSKIDYLSTQTLQANAIECDALRGTLSEVSVGPFCAGTAVFPAIDEWGNGALASVAVNAAEGTDALLVTPQSHEEAYVCSWETACDERGIWYITRRYSQDALDAMICGEFAPVEEVSVYWMALSFG